MTLDEAIAAIGSAKVRNILNSGRAYDPGKLGSLTGYGTAMALRGDARSCEAYMTLAVEPEGTVRQACRSLDELYEAAIHEGSGRAHEELARRGASMPYNAAAFPAVVG